MIVVSVMYPASQGSRFDMDYYLQKHVPLVGALWKDCGLTEAKVLRGASAPDGAAPAYAAMALVTFTSAADFQRALDQRGQEVLGDIPNFTNVQPVIQINDVML